MLGLLLSGFAAGLLAAEFELQPAAAILRLLAGPGSDPDGPERGLAMAAIASGTMPPLVFVLCSIAARGLESSRMRRTASGFAPASKTPGARDAGETRGLRNALGWTLAFGAAFVAGSIRLGLPLESAARDAAIVARSMQPAQHQAVFESQGRSAPRVIEARVQSREARGWGEEVVLFPVRGAGPGGPVPARLRLVFERGERTGDPRAVAKVEGETEDACPSRTRADTLLWPGRVVRLGVYIRALSSTRNPGSEDRARSAARRGIGARARLVDPDWVLSLATANAPSWGEMFRERAYVARSDWRDRVSERFASLGLSAGLARALAMGDRASLDPDVASALRRLGLAHLIAVSGLHVSLVAGAVGWGATQLFVLLGVGRRLPFAPFLLGLLAAWGFASVYGWMSGAGVSIQRAVLLFGLYAIFRFRHRSLRPLQALSGVALTLLVIDPAVLFELGARLSFLACAAMVVAGFWGDARVPPPLENVRGRFVRAGSRLGESFRMSLAISFATAPILFGVGFVVPALAPIWNVVAIPWTALLALPASIVAVLGVDVLPEAVLELLLLPTNAFESMAIEVDAIVGVVDSRQVLPAAVVPGLAATGVGLVRLHRAGIALVLWIGLVLLGSPPSLHGALESSPPRVIFFDVGQGDAALVEGHEGVIVVDAGGGADAATAGQGLVRGLRSLRVRRVDVLIVTHGDLDHRGGAGRILSELTVRELWLPAGGEQDDRLVGLARHAASFGTIVRWVSSGGESVGIGDLEVEVLWPPPGGSRHRSRNDGSLVVAVMLGDARVLFAADVGAAVEQDLLDGTARLAADVLKVGHHGSLKSSTSAFLTAVSATWAIVSAPCEAARGLPNRAILERLGRTGMTIGWTGRDGAVIFRGGRRAEFGIERWARSRACGG